MKFCKFPVYSFSAIKILNYIQLRSKMRSQRSIEKYEKYPGNETKNRSCLSLEYVYKSPRLRTSSYSQLFMLTKIICKLLNEPLLR